jgi:hypothetical protein
MMFSNRNICYLSRNAVILIVVSCIYLPGCGRTFSEPEQHAPTSNRINGDGLEENMSDKESSGSYVLEPEDYDKFQPGRPKGEILTDIHFYGNYEMGTTYEGKRVEAISFGLLGGPFSNIGDIVWAVFIDDKFQKFVQWPEWGVNPVKLGDFERLIRAVNSDPINISEYDKEMRMQSAPQHFDPGLTKAWLELKGSVDAKRANDLARNTELRDQFNASRIEIGITESNVEARLHAKPLVEGDYSTGRYRVYGSSESLDILPYQHYSNILILFEGGKVSGLYSGYSVPGGKDWLKEMQGSFSISLN